MNKAIASQEGPIRFHVNQALSVWGTLNPEWAERNARLGAASKEVVGEAVRLEQLFARFGVPYYLKVDIEGADIVCLDALKISGARPTYVSIESNKARWNDLLHRRLVPVDGDTTSSAGSGRPRCTGAGARRRVRRERGSVGIYERVIRERRHFIVTSQ